MYALSGIYFLIIKIGKGKHLSLPNGGEGRIVQELNEVWYCTASDRIINTSVAYAHHVKYDLAKIL